MEINPDDFCCPISLQLMTDPVILSSGHTFDRASIRRWLDSGHRTCPVTMLPLPANAPLIPNYALRSLISNFCRSNSTPLAQKSALSPLSFPANAPDLSLLLHLAKDDASFRRHLADSGAPSVLLRHAASPDNPHLQGLSIRILLHLSLDGDDARVGLVADGALDALTLALASGGPNAALAATALTSLAVVEVNKCSIGAHPSAIPALSSLIRSGGKQERREAATTLFELCKFPPNRPHAVRSGAVPPLLSFAADGSERAVQALALLAKCEEGRHAVSRAQGFAKVLARVLRHGSPRGIEHALLLLSLACSDSVEMARDAKNEGVQQLCFQMLESDKGKLGRNALMVLRVLEREL